MADAPNPEAIAWYLKRSEDLLSDLRDRVQALRTRGGQVAGFSGAVLALAGANVVSVLETLHGIARDCAAFSLLVGLLFLIVALVTTLRATLMRELVSDLSAAEVANYTSGRFTHEPDLWRDEVAWALQRAELFFLVGLSAVGVAFATLIGEVAF
jgi:hypothetical protein